MTEFQNVQVKLLRDIRAIWYGNKSSVVGEMGDRLATIGVGQKFNGSPHYKIRNSYFHYRRYVVQLHIAYLIGTDCMSAIKIF